MTPSLARAAPAEAPDALAAWDDAPPDASARHLGPGGGFSFVAGRFPTGVLVEDRAAAIAAAEELLAVASADFAPPANLAATLEWGELTPVVVGTSVIQATQVINGVPVRGAGLSAVFRGGVLTALYGIDSVLLVHAVAPSCDAAGLAGTLSPAVVEDSLAHVGAVGLTDLFEAPTDAVDLPHLSAIGLDPLGELVSIDAHSAYDARTGASIVVSVVGSWEIVTDTCAADPAAVRKVNRLAVGAKDASIRHDTFDDTELNTVTGSALHTRTIDDCIPSPPTERCFLERDATTTHDIPRIKDWNGTDSSSSSMFRDITLGTTPAVFNGTTQSDQEQQSTYYWIKLGRDWINSEVFGTVPPTTLQNLTDVWVDKATLSCGAFSGCYDKTTNRVSFKADSVPPNAGLIWHEYGHYVADNYGAFSSACDRGWDEGNPINEAHSDAMSYILASRYLGAVYRSRFPARLPSKHSSSSGPTTYPTIDCECMGGGCVPGDFDAYDFGDFWREAMWEILFNADCAREVCNNSTGASGTLWGTTIGWTNNRTAERELARALMYANSVSGPNVTFPAFSHMVFNYVYYSTPNPYVANNIRSVFAHHGITW